MVIASKEKRVMRRGYIYRCGGKVWGWESLVNKSYNDHYCCLSISTSLCTLLLDFIIKVIPYVGVRERLKGKSCAFDVSSVLKLICLVGCSHAPFIIFFICNYNLGLQSKVIMIHHLMEGVSYTSNYDRDRDGVIVN